MTPDAQLRSWRGARAIRTGARATRVGVAVSVIGAGAVAEPAMLVVAGASVLVVVVVVVLTGAAAAVLALPAVAHAVLDGLPLILPPFIALAVAVQPAPAVELGCAIATPPKARVAAAIRVVRVLLVFMAVTPEKD
jgi:hypothetical protein